MSYKVLSIAGDPLLGKSRDEVLQSAGFEVVAASNIVEVEQACEAHDLDAVVMGYGIPLREKRRIKATLRELCGPKIPVVALYSADVAEADDADVAIPAEDPEQLVKRMKELLVRNPGRAFRRGGRA